MFIQDTDNLFTTGEQCAQFDFAIELIHFQPQRYGQPGQQTNNVPQNDVKQGK